MPMQNSQKQLKSTLSNNPLFTLIHDIRGTHAITGREPITLHCVNAFGGDLSSAPALDAFLESPQKDTLGHGVTQRIEVAGAPEKPSSLRISIHNISPRRFGICLSKSTGLLKNRYPGRQSIVGDIKDNWIKFGQRIKIKARPSIGCIATLDEETRRPSRCTHLGGNIDLMALQAGSIIYLPIDTLPAQFCVGDIHARQGSGEIPGLGFEADADVTLSCEFVERIPYPVIEDATGWIIVGYGESPQSSQTQAVDNAIHFLKRKIDLSEATLYELLGGIGDLVFGNLTGKIPTHGVRIEKDTLQVDGFPLDLSPTSYQPDHGHLEPLLLECIQQFDKLPLLHQGDSREIRLVPSHPDLVIQYLNPKVFSFVDGGAVDVPGSNVPRAKLNELFCQLLRDNGIATTTLLTHGCHVLMERENVANIEVVVKGALIGSPKHLYPKLGDYPTRHGHFIKPLEPHEPYVRFDWRDPTSKNDIVMPEGLADQFIHVANAKALALKAFYCLKQYLNSRDFDLLDCCFFMNTTGTVICAEVSPDNLGGIVYRGSDPKLQALFQSKNKGDVVKKWEMICSKM